MIALLLASAGTVSPPCEAPPALRLDLSGFAELQLPVDLHGGTTPSIIAPPFSASDARYVERQGATRIVMRVPRDHLVHTAHSRFPRTELAERGAWRMADGCAALSARLTVDALPASGDVVIGQIHQRASVPRPPVELHYARGSIYAAVLRRNGSAAGGARQRLLIASGIGIGQPFAYRLSLGSNRRLTIRVDGGSVTTMLDPSFAASDLYFKAGAYVQDTKGGGAVSFEGLRITHTRR